MADDSVVSGVHPPGERSAGNPVPDKLTVDSFAAKISVQWAPQEAVTPLGQLPFFIDFLKQSDLFDQLVREAPLSYTSPNAPRPRDVLGTLVLSMVAGGWRYAHVNALRYDGVNPQLLGMGRMCSDDSVRRAVARLVYRFTLSRPDSAIFSRIRLTPVRLEIGVIREQPWWIAPRKSFACPPSKNP